MRSLNFSSLAFVASLVVSLPASARSAVSTDRKPSSHPTELPAGACIQNPNDPFDPDARMPKGPSEGQCIDNSFRRSVKVLTGEEAAPYAPQAGETVVANIYHNNQYWVARVKADRVDDVLFIVERYVKPKFIAHTQIRFRFKDGDEAVLVPQDKSLPRTEVRLKDLIFSAEAVGPKGFKLGFLKATRGYYALSYRMVSLEEKFDKTVRGTTRPVFQLPLNLDAEARNELFANALDEATHYGLSRTYNTFKRNCTSELFRIIDESVARSIAYKVKSHLLGFVGVLSGYATEGIKARGLLDKSRAHETPGLRQEYKELQDAIAAGSPPPDSIPPRKSDGIVEIKDFKGPEVTPTLDDDVFGLPDEE